ncbi:MAG: MerR family transcriptional regulator [Vicinamibacterales bacterium]
MPYRVGEFAALTGVTVRALQHYDRLGLLTPKRSDSGHRIYAAADRRRVRHILALRAVGMSLQRIGDLLTGSASDLPEALRAQRARLEQSRRDIEEALRILQQAAAREEKGGESLLDRLAAVVEMQDALESMRGYFSDEAWTKWGEPYFHDWPSAAWRVLFRDVEASLGDDPGSDRALELLERSMRLWHADIGSDDALARAVREGYGRAWHARARWPLELQRRYAEFKIEEIAKFLGAVQMASWRSRGLVHTYTTGYRSTA